MKRIIAATELRHSGGTARSAPVPESRNLDPADWDDFRLTVHHAADRLVDHLQSVRDGPVWRPVPRHVKDALSAPLPRAGIGTDAAFDQVTRLMLPYGTGNPHPGFMGWVHGGGTPGGMIAAMAEAAINANVGGRDHGAVYVERQVIEWMRQLYGFPADASGILTSGTSMGNLIALTVARNAKAHWNVRADGMGAEAARYRLYASDGVHNCIAKALEMLGFGTRALVRIPARANGSMDVVALAQRVVDDRNAGLRPFCVVATAGTVDVGAIDDLASIALVAKKNDLWLHVDGAFGALAMLAPDIAPRLQGIELADSLAFDFHKWAQVNYDCGCVLFRDKRQHRDAFSVSADYLAAEPRGLAAGAPWFCDLGPELSRGFRALKAWFLFTEHGADAIGDAVRRSCELARYLAERIDEEPAMRRLAPCTLNIVCFQVAPPPGMDADEFNRDIVADLQEQGIAAPSTTRIGGQLAIRCCIVNHRTTRADIDVLMSALKRVAAARTLKCIHRGDGGALQGSLPL
jgi:glutamate/tyrosine decarboxylase-like PLP-dependent enzyme